MSRLKIDVQTVDNEKNYFELRVEHKKSRQLRDELSQHCLNLDGVPSTASQDLGGLVIVRVKFEEGKEENLGKLKDHIKDFEFVG